MKLAIKMASMEILGIFVPSIPVRQYQHSEDIGYFGYKAISDFLGSESRVTLHV